MKLNRWIAIVSLLGIINLARPALAEWDEYDDSQSHPLRAGAYLLHPVGLLLEWTLFRPLHFLVSATKPQEYVFGHRPHPPMFEEGLPMQDYGVARPAPAPARQPPPAPKVSAAEPVAEKVVVKEVIVEKPVVKEVPKIVEVERMVFPGIAFNFDRADLTDYGRGMAYLTAHKLKEKADVVVVIEGHSDYIGTGEYNLRLGMRRAETVKAELGRLGIDPSRMSIASLGESQPLLPDQTDWARAVNRRVEFKIASQ
jgi:outer membrane protein OmpA-like peptidoglycan-associated protein